MTTTKIVKAPKEPCVKGCHDGCNLHNRKKYVHVSNQDDIVTVITE